ncbi:MAG: VanW family protein [Nitriliruptoraceae bacterium]
MISASVVGGVVVILVLALGVLWFVQRDQVLPNTTVGSTEVGGLTEPELRDTLEPVIEERLTEPVLFELNDETIELDAEDVGYRFDLDATVRAALAHGREGLPGDILTRLRSLRSTTTLPLTRETDRDALADWVTELADELDQQERRGDVWVHQETLEVSIEPSQGAVEVDRDELAELAHEALLDRHGEPLELPAETTEQPIADADLERTAAQLEEAVSEPLVLSANDEELAIEGTALARMIDVVEDEGGETGRTLVLEITEDTVEEELGEVAAGRFNQEPRDARYEANRTPPQRFDAQGNATYQPVPANVEVVEGRQGREFDPERTAEQLTELVRDGAHQAELDLARIEPDLPTDEAEDLAPTHAIGTFTTYYTAGQSRVTNIQRLADVIDGTLVLPDEQFSINDVSGPRTCDKGYVEAGTIIQGELEDTCGGGTSQFGTTTFNAAFFAGVQLDSWKAHSWYISRYPMGREATLSFGSLDVRFTNNTPGAVLVKTSHTATSVTVTLYGQPRANAVSATHGSPRDYRDFEEERREDDDLAPGEEDVLQSGGRGFKVTVTRTVDLVDGGEETRTINTTYLPQTRIVEFGPEDDDEDDEDDEDEDDD